MGTVRGGIIHDDGRDITWQDHAACRGQDPAVYDTDDDLKPSPEIRCFLCPVRLRCLNYALTGHESGTWGGLSRKQREEFTRRSRPRTTCPDPLCRSADIYQNNGVAACLRCGGSWRTVPARTRKSRVKTVNPVGT